MKPDIEIACFFEKWDKNNRTISKSVCHTLGSWFNLLGGGAKESADAEQSGGATSSGGARKKT